MPKTRCPCGHIVSDITDSLPYKAHIRTDEDIEKPLIDMAETIVGLLAARERGELHEFLTSALVGCGMDFKSADVIASPIETLDLTDILANLMWRWWDNYERWMYECDRCGRLLVQVAPERNKYVAYLPESKVRGILRSEGGDVPESDD